MRDGYCIEYEGANRYPITGKGQYHIFRGICLTIVGITLAVSLLLPQFNHKVLSFLIPGDDTVTLHALEELTDRLSSGEGTRDALAAFCRTVINHGQ